ncbi:hypothetical protein ES705_43185 [subsurface metagenome]
MDIEDIFDKNFGKHKAEHMQAIAKKYGVELREIYFIDDQLSYLMGTDALGVKFFWPDGVIVPKARKRKRKRQKFP